MVPNSNQVGEPWSKGNLAGSERRTDSAPGSATLRSRQTYSRSADAWLGRGDDADTGGIVQGGGEEMRLLRDGCVPRILARTGKGFLKEKYYKRIIGIIVTILFFPY